MIKERQKNPVEGKDMLARLLEVHDKDPNQLSFRELVAITTTNMYELLSLLPFNNQLSVIHSIAGSDTTAITLRAVFYYLSKNRTAYSALQQEIDLAISEKRLSTPATYNECAQLPYL